MVSHSSREVKVSTKCVSFTSGVRTERTTIWNELDHHAHPWAILWLAYNVLPSHRTIPSWFSEIRSSVSLDLKRFQRCCVSLDSLAPYFQRNSSSSFHNVHDSKVQLRHILNPFLFQMHSVLGCKKISSEIEYLDAWMSIQPTLICSLTRKRPLRSAERPKRLERWNTGRRRQKEGKMNPWSGEGWSFNHWRTVVWCIFIRLDLYDSEATLDKTLMGDAVESKGTCIAITHGKSKDHLLSLWQERKPDLAKL